MSIHETTAAPQRTTSDVFTTRSTTNPGTGATAFDRFPSAPDTPEILVTAAKDS
jgi:hypothetical protein